MFNFYEQQIESDFDYIQLQQLKSQQYKCYNCLVNASLI